MDLPLIGLGTWDLRHHDCTRTVQDALELGYRHIDTAHVYDNHAAIREGMHGFDRSKLFLTSKIHTDQIDEKKIALSVEKACNQALKELDTDYLDLYLIHWPDLSLPLVEIFQTMEQLVQKGKIVRAGVSNLTIHHLEDLAQANSHPFANQVEFHPYLYQKSLLEYCQHHDIMLIAYRPFGKGVILKDPLLVEIGLKHGKKPAQIILRWLAEQKIPTIPKSSSKAHLKENLEIFDFNLSPNDMFLISQLHRDQRYCKPGHPAFDY